MKCFPTTTIILGLALCCPLSTTADTDQGPKAVVPSQEVATISADKVEELFKYGLILRTMGQYGEALELYSLFLDAAPEHRLAPKIWQEVQALEKILAGQQSLIIDPYELRMDPLRKGFQIFDPNFYQDQIDEAIDQFPGEWEPYAFAAQNLIRLHQFEDAQKRIDKALKLGGADAALALRPIESDLAKRFNIHRTQQAVTGLINEGKLSEAAATLKSAWTADPALVHFGLHASALYTETKSYESAAEICLNIATYLKKHPNHPLAINAGGIQAMGEQAAKLKPAPKKSAPSRKSTPGTNPPPRKKPSPLDLYKQRTR